MAGLNEGGAPPLAPAAHVLDHLVFAARELDEGVARVEALLGVRMQPGGRHEGFGTHNRLLGFGGRAYMEVVSPDPGQPEPDGPRWFGLDTLESPRLVTWCVSIRDLRVPGSGGPVRSGAAEGPATRQGAEGRPIADLDAFVAHARAAGVDLGEPRRGMRARPDGSVLRWAMTDPWADRAGGVIPFLIDWEDSPHPAESLEAACRFVDVRVEHPEAATVERWLRALGLDMPVSRAQAPAVIATLETPNGTVELK